MGSLEELGISIVRPVISTVSRELLSETIEFVLTYGNWKDVVRCLGESASLVVFVISDFPSDGIRWELQEIGSGSTPVITVIEETYLESSLGFERSQLPGHLLQVSATRTRSEIDDFVGEMRRDIVAGVTEAELSEFKTLVESAMTNASSG